MMDTNHPGRPARPALTPRRPAVRVAGVGLLALAALVAILLAGCRPDQAPRLATSPAERATWPAVPSDAAVAKVERVVDGDTFVAAVAGRRERIRLIGVDTPETVDPDRPVQPYGKEASNFAKRMLDGRTVRLAGDVEPVTGTGGSWPTCGCPTGPSGTRCWPPKATPSSSPSRLT